MTMYAEVILEYAQNPSNKKALTQAEIISHDTNPLCGDAVTIYAQLQNNVVSKCTFEGVGCAISLAAASMLCEHVEGRTVAELTKLTKEQLLELLGIEVSYARLKCALLSLKTLKVGAYNFLATTNPQPRDADSTDAQRENENSSTTQRTFASTPSEALQ